MNALDKVLAYFAPAATVRRLQARDLLAYLTSPAYEAAKKSRARQIHKDGQSPDQIVNQSAEVIRAQARHLERNHDVSRGILRTMVNNVVGASGIGIEPQPRRRDGSIHEEYAAALRSAYREWSVAPEVTRRLAMPKLQRMLCRAWIRDGEVFAQEVVGTVKGMRYPSRVPFALELFEAEMVPMGYDDGANVRQGIECNAWGQPVAYMVYKRNPYDGVGLTYMADDMKRLPADRVYHLAMVDRLQQRRGVSEFASIITRLEDMKDYEESERIAAKIAASLTAYVKRNSPDGYVGPSTDENGNPVPRSLAMQPGTIIDSLQVGEEIGLIDSNRPNPNVVTFRQGQLRAVAAGVGASYSSIARAYDGTYSAQRQEMVEQWANYATLTDDFVGQFMQPLYAAFVRICDISGVVPRPADVVAGTEDDAYFVAQAMPWIDPMKEAEAYVALVRAGFASEVEVLRRRGVNPRDVLEQQSTFRKAAKEKGLVLTSDGANPQNGAPAAQPQQTQQAAEPPPAPPKTRARK